MAEAGAVFSGDDDEQVIVDTSRGFRPNAQWDDYVGQCERTGGGFLCKYEPAGSIWLLHIYDSSRGRAFFSLSHSAWFQINALGGACTKA